MSTRTKVAATVGVALALLCLGVYALFFHARVSAHVVSVSPDGMFKCELTERSNGGQSAGEIVLYQRMSPWTPEDWEAVDKGGVYNDSACRSNYSINWAYNEKHRSTGVVVFGDFGGAPFAGTMVYERTLDPAAKLRGEK